MALTYQRRYEGKEYVAETFIIDPNALEEALLAEPQLSSKQRDMEKQVSTHYAGKLGNQIVSVFQYRIHSSTSGMKVVLDRVLLENRKQPKLSQ